MPKNIVICCDGTNGEFRRDNTNVVRLFAMLEHDPARQVTVYNPGLGTMSAPGALTWWEQAYTKLIGLAFGYGLARNVGEAYRELMQLYEEGDRICLFGFSRGAYTVRALAGMIHMFGLLRRGQEVLIPYATAMFRSHSPEVFTLAAKFKATFSRECGVEFVGVWDTVSSIGWITDPVSLPYTANNPSVRVGRQALAIDERRCFFRQNLWRDAQPQQDVKQVWFAGVHSDVGGGYPAGESGLANVALKWMVAEAQSHGLMVAPRVGDPGSGTVVGETSSSPLHRSLTRWWWIAEFVPKPYTDMSMTPPRRRWRLGLGRRRWIAEGSVLHASVVERLKDPRAGYQPPNIPRKFEIEPKGS